MKCSNFYKLVNELKDREKSELIAALNAHGGSYDFYHDSNEIEDIDEDADDFTEIMDNLPCVACNPDNYDPDPVDVIVTSVKVKDGWLSFECYEKGYYNSVSVAVDDFFVGQLEYVISAIPETDDVNDVTGK